MRSIALALALLLTTAAHAQQRTYYGADGRVIGRSTIDSQGTVTIYDNTGRATARSSNGTTYDATTGRVIIRTERSKR